MSHPAAHRAAQPTVLDVTLRDGGYLNDWRFSDDQILDIVNGLDPAGIDVVEVGYLSDDVIEPPAARCTAELLSRVRERAPRTRIAAMMRPDLPDADAVIRSRHGLIDLVRITAAIRQPGPAIQAARRVRDHGITASINLTSVSAFTDDELLRAIEAIALEGSATCLYLADSRGALRPDEVRRLVPITRGAWPGVLGFHGHDNLGLALENSEVALSAGCTWVDGSLKGLGLGGQNTNLHGLVQAARPDLRDALAPLKRLAERIDLPAPAEPATLYALAGEKNLKQEWIPLLVEQHGAQTELLLHRLERAPYQTFEEALGRIGDPASARVA